MKLRDVLETNNNRNTLYIYDEDTKTTVYNGRELMDDLTMLTEIANDICIEGRVKETAKSTEDIIGELQIRYGRTVTPITSLSQMEQLAEINMLSAMVIDRHSLGLEQYMNYDVVAWQADEEFVKWTISTAE